MKLKIIILSQFILIPYCFGQNYNQFIDELTGMHQFDIGVVQMFPGVKTGRAGKDDLFGSDVGNLFEVVLRHVFQLVGHAGAHQRILTSHSNHCVSSRSESR